MYINHEQETHVEFVLPGSKSLIPHKVTLVRQKPNVTVLRMAIVAFAALEIIFLAVTCFRRTKAHLLDTSNRRKLARFEVGEGPSEDEDEDGGKWCQQGATEHNTGEVNEPPQDTSGTGKGERPRNKSLAGSEDALTSPKKSKNTESTKAPGSPSAARRSRQLLRSVLACFRGMAGCLFSSETQEAEDSRSHAAPTATDAGVEKEVAEVVQEGEGSSADQSADPAEASISPKKHKKKIKHTRESRFSANAFDRLFILGNLLSQAVSYASQQRGQGLPLQPDSIWLLETLERSTSESITDGIKASQQASGRLTTEQLSMYLKGLETAMDVTQKARELISPDGVESEGSGSSEQPTQPFISVVVNATLAAILLERTLDEYEKQPSQTNLEQLMDAYHKGHESFDEAEALLALLDGPVFIAARVQVRDLMQKLAMLSETASDRVLDPSKYAEAQVGASGAAFSAGSGKHVSEKRAKAQAKANAKLVLERLKGVKRKARSEAKKLAKVSSPEAQLTLSILFAEAVPLATAAKELIVTGLLEPKQARDVESALSEMEEAINDFITGST